MLRWIVGIFAFFIAIIAIFFGSKEYVTTGANLEAYVGLLAIAVSLFATFPFLEKKDHQWNSNNIKIVKTIAGKKSVFQGAALIVFKKSTALNKRLASPITPVRQTNSLGISTLPAISIKTFYNFISRYEVLTKFFIKRKPRIPIFDLDTPWANLNARKIFDLEAVEQRVSVVSRQSIRLPSKSSNDNEVINRITDQYGYPTEDYPTYILHKTKQSGTISSGGELVFRLGRYREFFEFCDVPIWEIAEKLSKPFTNCCALLLSALPNSQRHQILGLSKSNGDFVKFCYPTQEMYFRQKFLNQITNGGHTFSYQFSTDTNEETKQFTFRSRHEYVFNAILEGKAKTMPPLGMGVLTLTIIVLQDRAEFLLLRRGASGSVTEAVGQTSVVPGGNFQGTDLFDSKEKRTVTSTVIRELAEELYGFEPVKLKPEKYNSRNDKSDTKDEDNKSDTKDEDKTHQIPTLPVTKLSREFTNFQRQVEQYIESKQVRLFYLGTGVDILTAKLQMFTALVIPGDLLEPKSTDGENKSSYKKNTDNILSIENWQPSREGSLESWPFELLQLEKFLADWENENFSSAGIGCLNAAYCYFDMLSNVIHEFNPSISVDRKKVYTASTRVGFPRNSTIKLTSDKVHSFLKELNV